MEKWYARSLGGVSGKADCLMGHKVGFFIILRLVLRKRKKSDILFVGI